MNLYLIGGIAIVIALLGAGLWIQTERLDTAQSKVKGLEDQIALQKSAVESRDKAIAARDTAIAERDKIITSQGGSIDELKAEATRRQAVATRLLAEAGAKIAAAEREAGSLRASLNVAATDTITCDAADARVVLELRR